MLRSWIALILVPSLLTGCLMGAALDWAHPEVTIRGQRRDVAPENRITLWVEVKNVETLQDGHYLIHLPGAWPPSAARSGLAVATATSPIELPLEFAGDRSFFLIQCMRALAFHHFHSRVSILDERVTFPLRADVEKDEHGSCRIVIYGDLAHDDQWTPLATSSIGRGTQGPRQGLEKLGMVTF